MKSKNSSYLTQIKALIKSLGGHFNLLAFPRIFIDITGDITLAAMLSQLIYWSDRTTDPQGYVYKSADDWFKEVKASRYAVTQFKKLPFIISKIKRAEGAPTSFYKIDFPVLFDHIQRFLSPTRQISSNQPAVNGQSLTYTTSDTTPDTISLQGCPPEKQDLNSAGEEEVIYDTLSSLQKAQDQELLTPVADPVLQAYKLKLAEITGFDISFPNIDIRVSRVAALLKDSGYSLKDLDEFLPYWRQKDWRWKKDQQLPAPEDVIALIKRSKDNKTRGIRELYASWKK